jgi:GDPmannose 4,6-dehydratase
MNKTALVTGIGGQDGSYLAELLLKKDYKVVGLYRRSSVNNLSRINHFIDHPNLFLEETDITDPSNVIEVLSRYNPNEIYNLAAQSHVQTSFKSPSATFEINTLGVINLLEGIRLLLPAQTKFYQASTSEMFGRNYSMDPDSNEKYQDENTELLPQSPYGVAKVASHRMVQLYRSSYNMFACSGILFNHESPRRGENFVTRKITKWIGEFVRWRDAIDSQEHDYTLDPNFLLKRSSVSLGGNDNVTDKFPKLRLGNLEAYRDWGHAKDYVHAMWLMLQQDQPDDFVISTGETHTVKEFLELAFSKCDLDYKDFVIIDPDLYRPAEVDYLRGHSDKARAKLNWVPEYSFESLVEDMMDKELERIQA